jgi:hypothetical protein
VCLTQSSGGRTVMVGVGWTVGLDLHTPNMIWSGPSEFGARLLRQVGPIGRSGGAVQVAYRTLAPGRTELHAFERPVCPPGEACPQFILVWEVHLRVSGG